mmetsp:Transcript_19024/g.65446  ORF Transcript_19024/g.65446 Transcript_19024/m.65446 type:complete len:116 (-) Transcript_19024:4096-4443(-)
MYYCDVYGSQRRRRRFSGWVFAVRGVLRCSAVSGPRAAGASGAERAGASENAVWAQVQLRSISARSADSRTAWSSNLAAASATWSGVSRTHQSPPALGGRTQMRSAFVVQERSRP